MTLEKGHKIYEILFLFWELLCVRIKIKTYFKCLCTFFCQSKEFYFNCEHVATTYTTSGHMAEMWRGDTTYSECLTFSLCLYECLTSSESATIPCVQQQWSLDRKEKQAKEHGYLHCTGRLTFTTTMKHPTGKLWRHRSSAK